MKIMQSLYKCIKIRVLDLLGNKMGFLCALNGPSQHLLVVILVVARRYGACQLAYIGPVPGSTCDPQLVVEH